MAYETSGSLETNQKEAGETAVWDTNADWQDNSKASNVVIENDKVKLKKIDTMDYIIVAHTNGNAYALDYDTGNKIWEIKDGDTFFFNYTYNSGTYYVNPVLSPLQSINESDGNKTILTSNDWDSNNSGGESILIDGVIYSVYDSYIGAYNLSTDSILWEKSYGVPTTIPIYHNGYIYSPYDSGIVKLNASDGTEEFTNTNINVGSNLIIYGSDLIVSASDGIYKMDMSDGSTTKWASGNFYYPGIFLNDALYSVSPDDSNLYKVTSSGKTSLYSLAGFSINGATYLNDDFYYANGNSKIISYDIQNNNLNWGYSTTSPVNTHLSIVGNTVYAGLDSGEYLALNTDGTKKWLVQNDTESVQSWVVGGSDAKTYTNSPGLRGGNTGYIDPF